MKNRIICDKYIFTGIILLLIVLVGCEEEEDIVTKFKHPKMDQTFQIVNAYKLYDEFIEKALKEDQQENIEALYETKVMDPIYDQCIADGEHKQVMDLVWDQSLSNLKDTQKLIEGIDSESINGAVKDALIKSSNLLPSEIENTVCVFPTLGEESLVGFNVGAGKILLFHSSYLDEEDYKITTAHEYHHSVWTEKFYDQNDYSTVLENLVFEGKAVVFEELVYPEMYSYSTPVYSTYDKNHWKLIEADLNRGDSERSLEILYGEGELPPYYGYSEGYKIVMNYLEQHPDLEPDEWLGIDGKEIFEEGEYRSNYE